MKKIKNRFYIGDDTAGRHLVVNLERCYHLLIGGRTGAGKSNTLHQIITTADADIIIIDPKQGAEFNEHRFACKIASQPDDILATVRGVYDTMERRLASFAGAGCKDIKTYNQTATGADQIRHLILIIDEYQEALNIRGVKSVLFSLVMKGRAAGVHLFLATQRPDASTSTRLKSQCNYRLALKVNTPTESRMIIGATGAEKIKNPGDFLLLADGEPIEGHTPLYIQTPPTAAQLEEEARRQAAQLEEEKRQRQKEEREKINAAFWHGWNQATKTREEYLKKHKRK